MSYRPHFCTILFIVFGLAACTRDKAICKHDLEIGCMGTDSFLIRIKDTLFSMPEPPPFGWLYQYNRQYQYYSPCFNPTNQNEFVYLRWNMSTSIYDCELRMFNICTGHDRLVCSNVHLGGRPQWNRDNWILFTGGDGDLWKIRSSGVELAKLTIGPNFNKLAVWNPNGNKILFYQQANGANYIIEIDSIGSYLDTFPKLLGTGYWSWTRENILALGVQQTIRFHGVGYYDFVKDTVVQIEGHDITDSFNLIVKGVSWFDKNRYLLWSCYYQLAKVDSMTGNNTVIRRGADNARYEEFSISADEQKIIVERVDRIPISANVALKEDNIYIMNKDGSDLRKIKFPE